MAYAAKDIEVLEGLEPVRKRPAMYIGGTDTRGYHHLLWEILDNAVDEVINGHATQIEVCLGANGKCARVRDDGRGIPVDKHPKFKRSALELILTTLHAGGKFGGQSYQVAGGLHGVGSSVVNALSVELKAIVRRDGCVFEQSYARGKALGPLKKVGALPARARPGLGALDCRGTTIAFRPDPEIFGAKARFDLAKVRERLEAKSYLHRGLRIVFVDEASGATETFHHPEGIAAFLKRRVAELGLAKVHEEAFVLDRAAEPRLELALQWTEAPHEELRSYANGVPTTMGGTHETGVKQALTKALRAYMQAHKILPKGLNISAEDVREGVVAVLSVYVAEPQFQGQTKDRLNNPEVAGQVEGAVRAALEPWLNQSPSIAESIVARVILAARAREASRAASQQVSRKTAVSHRLNLPGKLADCASTDPGESELFLVEGDSAGGNAKQGRDRRTQAILPLRGKVLNTERANLAAIMANKELQDVVRVLGCGIGKDFDLSKLRYDKVFLLMDADSDGHHIATLLLTFFYRHLPGLLRGGHVYLAQPPLFRIDAAKETHWAADEAERDAILAKLPRNQKPEISRFKGLGEMTAQELKETTLDRGLRRALRLRLEHELEADQTFNDLMGKDPAPRFRFIMDGRLSVEELDL